MARTLKEIAALVQGELVGDGTIVIKGVAGIQDAGEGEITFLANPRYAPFLERTGASAVITGRDTVPGRKPVIRTDNPSLAFTKAVEFIAPPRVTPLSGIHPTAVVGKNVTLGKDVALGPHVVIADGAAIGKGSSIHAGCYIGEGSRIGEDCLLYPGVSLREHVSVGNRVIIHNGAVLGSDGFGFVTVGGVHHKIPQTGTVEVGDDVEIGANVTVDRARFDTTVIGSGTKIDNLVHIAHNVIIGKNCLIVAQVGISGSTEIGNNVILAGQVGTVGHIKIGDNSVAMAKAGVSKSLPEGSVVWGTPAQPAQDEKKMIVLMHNLPKLYERVKELEKKAEKGNP